MRRLWVVGIIVLLAATAGCAPLPPPPIDSLAFQKRPPLPGQPGYLQTIHYINDGVRYVSPAAGFLVSATGDLCFQGVLVPGVTPEYIPPYYWCISPLAVSRVDAVENDISYINQVRLWCRLAAPQCAYKVEYPNMFDDMPVANSIITETVPFFRQRDAIEYLVYLMGGNLQREQAMQ
jgi:hypothetical protein